MSILNLQMMGRFPQIKSFSEYKGVSGIYAIVHAPTGRMYVGCASNLKYRLGHHLNKLRYNNHDNCYLQNAWNKYGASEFVFLLLEKCSVSDLAMQEGKWMAETNCCNRDSGFNLDVVAIRKSHCDETKKKMSLARLGKKHSEETKKKIADLAKGRPLPPRTPEQRMRHALAQYGRKYSLESRQKMSASRMGRIITPEWRKKLSISVKAALALKKKRKEQCQLSLLN